MKKLETWCPVCGGKNKTPSRIDIDYQHQYSMLGISLASAILPMSRRIRAEYCCEICHSEYSFETDQELIFYEE